MIDVASRLAELHSTGVVILTWVCERCARGWAAPQGRQWPTCDRCGRPAGQRGAHLAIPLQDAA